MNNNISKIQQNTRLKTKNAVSPSFEILAKLGFIKYIIDEELIKEDVEVVRAYNDFHFKWLFLQNSILLASFALIMVYKESWWVLLFYFFLFCSFIASCRGNVLANRSFYTLIEKLKQEAPNK